MLDIAYLAGFFDGEGWITVSHWKNAKKCNPSFSEHYVRYQLVVGFANTNLPLMKRIHAQCGGNFYSSPSAYRRNPKNRIAYSIRMSSGRAAYFLRQLRPYLVAKADEADLAIELQDHIEEHKGVVRYDPERALAIYTRRQSLTDKIRALKKRRYDLMPAVSSDARLSCGLSS